MRRQQIIVRGGLGNKRQLRKYTIRICDLCWEKEKPDA